LLVKFHQENQDITEQIQQAFEQKDNELVQRLAHTVKGVAGNIGEKDIQKAGEVVDLGVKNGALDGIQKSIQTLKEKIDIPMMLLSDIVNIQKNEGSDEKEKPKGSSDQLSALLKELESLLKKRKPKPCKEVMVKIEQFDWSEDLIDLVNDLDGFVSKYKFKKTGQKL
jgi:two-component system, sensor histidine kinase and response regulator